MEKLKQLRKEKGISQSTVAKAAGISIAAYSNIENGVSKSITIDVGKGIADALGVSFNVLFDIETVQLGTELLQKSVNKLQEKNSKLENRILELEQWLDQQNGYIESLKAEKLNLKKEVAARTIQAQSFKIIQAKDYVKNAKGEKEKRETELVYKMLSGILIGFIKELENKGEFNKYDIFSLIFENDVEIQPIIVSGSDVDKKLYHHINGYISVSIEEMQEFRLRLEKSYQSP